MARLILEKPNSVGNNEQICGNDSLWRYITTVTISSREDDWSSSRVEWMTKEKSINHETHVDWRWLFSIYLSEKISLCGVLL